MHREGILEAVAPEKHVVVKPHRVEQPTRDRKGEESSHGCKQLVEGVGDPRDTTSSVSAKAKTASAKPSIRETSWPRQEKPSSPPIRLWANLLRSTASVHQLPTSPKLLWAGSNATLAAEVAATELYEGAARSTFKPLEYHQTCEPKIPLAIFQTVSLGTWVNKGAGGRLRPPRAAASDLP